MKRTDTAARGAILGLLLAGCQPVQVGQEQRAQPIANAPLVAAFATSAVPHDTDDPAIWIHPTDPAKSLIFGTDKEEKEGGIFVFDLDGRIVDSVTGVNYPNNVDVAGPIDLVGERVDIAVASERESNRLRILAIDRQTGRVREVSGANEVFKGAKDKEMSRPMGVALERTPDGLMYVWLSRKVSPATGALGRYRLIPGEDGSLNVGEEELFGEFSGDGEIEALCRVPDGRVFYSDENFAVKQLDPKSDTTVAFGKDGFTGDREGIAYAEHRGKKLLFVSDQIEGGSELEVFDITGAVPKHVATIKTTADDTDGIEITQRPLGDRFPKGVLVMMNSKDKNFLVYDLRDVLVQVP